MTDQNDETQKPNIQADHKSVAVGSIAVGGSTGDINIHAGDIGYSVEEVSVLLTQITSTFRPKPFDRRCPYKGLDVFEEEDAELFFGREKLVDDLVGRVKGSRTVFVTGPSGSGKSSLVRAGLIPALKREGIKNNDRWLYETMKPGRDPIGELGRVASSLAGSTNAEDEIRAKAIADATIFARWCEIALKDGREKRAVIFIDQFEEVFTQINKEEDRVAFLNLLTHAAAVENGRVIILFSMRSDFVSNCATYPQLNALLNQEFLQIGAMQPDELVSAIAQPALRVGLRIDPDLVAQIINEMQGEPGTLPLMQFALKDLFDSRQEKDGIIALALGDYLERGGIHKALERHADKAFAGLSENEQELAHSIFGGLIEIGRGTQDTKRTALFDELIPANTRPEEVETIVQKLAAARLITTDEVAGKDTVTISHEKLIDAWPWLKRLVNENRDVIALKNEIASDSKEWDDHHRDSSYLYTGSRLASVREQLEANKFVLSGLAQEYVRAGIARQKRGQFVLIGGISTVIALLIAAVIIFASLTNQAQEQAEEAKRQAQIALARQLAAQAISNLKFDPERSILLALQAASTTYNEDNQMVVPEAEDALHQAVQTSHLRLTLTGHTNEVNGVSFSPDGKQLASTSSDGTVKVWDTATGKDLFTLTTNRGTFPNAENISITFSPNGKLLATATEDNTVKIWDMTTHRELFTLKGHSDHVVGLAFSPDGMQLATASFDRTVKIWDIRTGKEITSFQSNGRISSVAFSPDGQQLVSGNVYLTATVWDRSTGKEIRTLTGHGGSVSSVAFSPDGSLLATASVSGEVKLWTATTGQEILTLPGHSGGTYNLAFSPDGKRLATAGQDKTAKVWDVITGKELFTLAGHTAQVLSISFSPDGMYVTTASRDKTIKLWIATPDQELMTLMGNSGRVTRITYSPDGARLAVSSLTFDFKDGMAKIYSAVTGEELLALPNQAINDIEFNSAGTLLATANRNNTATVWDSTTGEELLTVTTCDCQIMTGGVIDVAFSPDGMRLVTTSVNDAVHVWDVTTGQQLLAVEGSWYSNTVFSPDGEFLANGNKVWDGATGREVYTLAEPDSFIHRITFSSIGDRLATASRDETAKLWDAETGQLLYTLKGHAGGVTNIAFFPDGQRLTTQSYADRTVKIWDTNTGNEILTLKGNNIDFIEFALDPAGSRLAIAGSDETIGIYVLPIDELIQLARSRLTRTWTSDECQKYLNTDSCPPTP